MHSRACATFRRWLGGPPAISWTGFSADWTPTTGSRCSRSDRASVNCRLRDRGGAFRVIYLARLADRIVVLHAFQKKTQRTAKQDIDLAAKRLRELRKG